MATSKGVRPADWSERAGPGAFAGWIVPDDTAARLAPLFAAIATAAAAAYPLVFADQIARSPKALVAPLVFGLAALVLWCRAAVLRFPPVRFRVADGRLYLRKIALPIVSTVSLSITDVTEVRAVSHQVRGKLIKFDLWDVIIDTRDGIAHRVKLSRVVGDEATWIAQRVATAVGAT